MNLFIIILVFIIRVFGKGKIIFVYHLIPIRLIIESIDSKYSGGTGINLVWDVFLSTRRVVGVCICMKCVELFGIEYDFKLTKELEI